VSIVTNFELSSLVAELRTSVLLVVFITNIFFNDPVKMCSVPLRKN